MTGGPELRRVGIIGLGMIGGSIARALRRLANPPEIAAFSRESKELERAVADGVIRRAAVTPLNALRDAEWIIYAAPVEATLRFMGEHREVWPEGAVIMDVGSVKRAVMNRARELELGGRFIGAHPMAGNERSGYAASRADMFEGARVWLCPAGEGRTEVRAMDFWRILGARPARIQPDEHDRLMARVSQLPQIVSSALGLTLRELGTTPADLGPGARDMTRLAASSPDLWSDLLRLNSDLLAEPIAKMLDVLKEAQAALEAGEEDRLLELLEGARRWRKERE